MSYKRWCIAGGCLAAGMLAAWVGHTIWNAGHSAANVTRALRASSDFGFEMRTPGAVLQPGAEAYPTAVFSDAHCGGERMDNHRHRTELGGAAAWRHRVARA